MTQQFVKERLKSPGSASFGSLMNDYQRASDVCKPKGNETWHCLGWVDSQNSFGAMLRTKFFAVVHHTGNDNWKLEDFAFGE